nr:MAG TPA: hypothetical protein [Caudoviricetes sp.]
MMGNIKINLVRDIHGNSEEETLLFFDTFKQTLTALVSQYPWHEGTTLVLNKMNDNKYKISGNILIKDPNTYDDIFDFFDQYEHGVESHIVSFIQILFNKWSSGKGVNSTSFTLTQPIKISYLYRKLFAEAFSNSSASYISLYSPYTRYFREKMLSLLVDEESYNQCLKVLSNFKLEFHSEYLEVYYTENINETLSIMDRNIQLIDNLLECIKDKCSQLKHSVIFEPMYN